MIRGNTTTHDESTSSKSIPETGAPYLVAYFINSEEHSSISFIVKILQTVEKCSIVRKCLDNQMCTNFDNYFEVNTHRVNTRNNKYILKLPKVKFY